MEIFILGLGLGFMLGIGWGQYKAYLDAEYWEKRRDDKEK